MSDQGHRHKADVAVSVFGTARGNPGLAGIGGLVSRSNSKHTQRFAEFLGVCTRSRAEFRAILIGLRFVNEGNSSTLELRTAHETAFRQLIGRSRATSPETIDLLTEASDELSRRPNVTLRLVSIDELEIPERLADVAIDSRGRRVAFD